MIGIVQSLRHQQTQSISPRLQHAVRLLQMSSQDFSATMQELLASNPFLEAAEAEAAAEQPREPANAAERADTEEPAYGDDREIWSSEGRGSGLRRADDGENDALASTACSISLHDHMRSQINVLRLPERDRLLACIVAESVDDDGYLRVELDDLAALSGLVPAAEPDEMSIALRRVQALDPSGVGARDVAECLRLQLGRIPDPAVARMARHVIDHHLDLVAARDTVKLARLAGISPADAAAVCRQLKQLDPRPGWQFESSQAPYAIPDVLAFKARGQWQVKLNPAVMPKVRLNQVYEELFKRHRGPQHIEMAHHLQEARWAVRNIDQRFCTIQKIAQAIVVRQRHFLEYGAMGMKPLALKEIADEVGVHESTVCRVSHNKFLAAPSGVYELKYFFSRAMVGRDGSSCSSTAIRGLIRELIESEPATAPLSDAEIARQLAQQGLEVARRTITKYRQMMKIEAVDRRGRRGAP